ncbi:MarR family winged helix-turn-helix transcriptional regulator [Lentzea flaviverrucosa]|uniref:DNA-binding transcriptional regulator, MarR family n=1 Tax=Lentzea flaviverrucosa TaxID=200379 RepID=A0A1H9XVT9_9PSEU|nr:MarR family transcriptional regulator [Lentzea flaviverrucosa]RDI18277.1 DNA-binding MarR family transcriptional regulator [Lentzea flaviverrucosa]SES50214.1 DNA-binding transcriptional regulator, MarR family [Lentzea flaviverrucosa]
MRSGDRIGGDIKRTELDLVAAKSAAVKPAGLTVPQYAALLALSEHPGAPAATLARLCLTTPQTMTTILQNLVALGLVERTSNQWQRNVLENRLTEAGQARFREADKAAVMVEQKLADAFTDEERAQLRALLQRCSDVLSEK